VLGQAQGERARLVLGSVPWPELAGSLRRTFQDRAAEKGLSFQVHDSDVPPLRGDRGQLERMLENLVSNAIKYTPPGGQVEVLAEPRGEQQVRVQVRDSGIGIPQAARARLFEEFYRADNAKGLDEIGSGLGLAIAREIVSGHGGTIAVESEEGRGSTFSVDLPATGAPLPEGEREHVDQAMHAPR
jgi:signal transduction histidine kinase